MGVDVGGTFTDVILHGADGRVVLRKLLSTPPSYDRAVVDAVGGLAAAHAGTVAEVVHGTTVATNAVLERRGSRRPSSPRPASATCSSCDGCGSRTCTTSSGASRRRSSSGTSLRAERARRRGRDDRPPAGRGREPRARRRLRATGVESVAVCFLHSYLYPEHEQRFGAILAEELPDANVSLSSEILREQREYEALRDRRQRVRAAADVVVHRPDPHRSRRDRDRRAAPDHAVVGRRDDRGGREGTAGLRARVGPAAGVVAARGMGEQLGVDNLLAFDMGGTTAKASLIEGGAISAVASTRSVARCRREAG